jgi:ABC-type branched-subunit amino acid transport system substrate-binding protein
LPTTCVHDPIFLSAPEVAVTEGLGKLLKDAFLARIGAAPNIPFIAATAYDGATALISALDNSSRGYSDKTLEFLDQYNAQGILGRISFDENGDAIGINYSLKTLKNGVAEAAH